MLVTGLLAAVLVAAPPPSLDPMQLEYPSLLEQAEAAYVARDAERSTVLFHEIVTRTPGRAEAWYGLSRAHEWAGRLPDAIVAAERAQQIGWQLGARGSYRVAQLHARAGQKERALEWLSRSLDERYEDRPEIASDEAFAAFHDDPEFRRLAGMPPPSPASRDDRWRFDLDYLVEESRRMHADPARPAFAEPFETAAAELRSAIPESSDDEIFQGMMRLLALLDDGHTALYGPDPDTPYEFNGRQLPFKFYLFPEGLYIVGGIGEWDRHAGSRVVRFGHLEAGEVLRRLNQYRGGDNAITWTWLGPQFYIGRLALLRAVGASDSDATVELALQTLDGETTSIEVEGGSYEIPRKLRPSSATAGNPPLWLSRVDENYWIHPMPEQGVVYLQFNSVRNAEGESIAELAERLRTTLEAEMARRLIVDVRHNNGGNNSLVRPLIRAMIDFEMSGADRRIVVLTGRNTFSAAQNFINRVEQWTDAQFAGEPSSASPNFVGEETNLLLPYSRLRGSISTLYWQDSSPSDRRPFIPVDLPVELRAADYFAGRDPVLEAVLGWIAETLRVPLESR